MVICFKELERLIVRWLSVLGESVIHVSGVDGWQVGPRLVGRMDDIRDKETDLLMLPTLAEFFKQETPKTLPFSSEDG